MRRESRWRDSGSIGGGGGYFLCSFCCCRCLNHCLSLQLGGYFLQLGATFFSWGGAFLGVLVRRALLFGVYTRAPLIFGNSQSPIFWFHVPNIAIQYHRPQIDLERILVTIKTSTLLFSTCTSVLLGDEPFLSRRGFRFRRGQFCHLDCETFKSWADDLALIQAKHLRRQNRPRTYWSMQDL